MPGAWGLRALAATWILASTCRASFSESYNLLMAPVKQLLDSNLDCGWAFLPDLPTLASTSSEFEESIVLKEDKCGFRSMLMGGYVQCHMADEHIYHEMMVHPALVHFALVNGRPPRSVFLGGSGEGAGAREILRWKSVEKVTMVDIDMEVTNFSSKWMPQLANGSFESPRLNFIVGDAVKYLREMPDGETFDVLIMDFPDPFEGEILYQLYEKKFYGLVRSRMHAGSLVATQSGPCDGGSAKGDEMKCQFVEKMILKNMASVFDHAGFIMHPMATWKEDENTLSDWSTVSYGVLREGDSMDPFDLLMPQQIADKVDSLLEEELVDGASSLRYFGGAVHQASLAKPEPLWTRLQTRAGKGAKSNRPSARSDGVEL